MSWTVDENGRAVWVEDQNATLWDPRQSQIDQQQADAAEQARTPSNTGSIWGGPEIGSPEYNAAMNRAYNGDTTRNWNDYQADQLKQFFAGLNGGNQVNSGYGGPSPLQQMLDQINATYDRQRGLLDQNRMQAGTNITNQVNAYRSNVGNNMDLYQQGAQASQEAMARRIAEQIAAAQNRNSELERSAASMGQATGAINAQARGNLDTLRTSGDLQKALSERIGQIVANNGRMAMNAGDLVQQGAMGNLENNYMALRSSLDANREQQILAARQGASGGGGSGGGGGRSGKISAAEAKAMREQDMVDTAFSGGNTDAMLAALFSINPDYANYIVGTDAPEGIDQGDWIAAQVGQAIRPHVSQQVYQQTMLDRVLSELYAGGNRVRQ